MSDKFDLLINNFIENQIDEKDLSDHIDVLLIENPEVNIVSLLQHIQNLFSTGSLTPDKYRFLAETVTRLNIEFNLRQKFSNETDITTFLDEEYSETVILTNTEDEEHEKTVFIDLEQPLNNEKDNAEQPAFTHSPNKNSNQTKTTLINESLEESQDPVELGTILKKRFVLIERIGKGGMGYVYKARDLVRVQARDSDPYVAIKVLSENFKQHSGAFIALQREASKSQRLAHPNIATVYDFDHDGDVVYMTMELMRGQPFNKLIKDIAKTGLPKEEALGYTEQICHALMYAHKQSLIHSDLKPANIFLNENGVVKILDFGITRAIKSNSKDIDEDTVFDPASLKALTPAYASIEMFEGASPDPRDDIYALACVAYELLSGSHPYKKVAAHKAKELGLKPNTIKGLTRTQQKTLQEALKLDRLSRTPTVEKFLSGIQRQKTHTKKLAIAAGIAILTAGLLLINPLQKQQDEENRLQLIQSIKSGNEQDLVNLLTNINDQDENTRVSLISILRKEIITYYQKQINNAIDAKQQNYNFPAAYNLLAEVKSLYPDSASLAEAEKQLTRNKERLVEILTNRYNTISESGGDTTRILKILSEVDPKNTLLIYP